MATRHFIPTTVISGFPAIGKSFIASRFPNAVRDLESSDYQWLRSLTKDKKWEEDEFGNRIRNELWPENYIRDIKILEKSGMYKFIMVSSHEMIRNELKAKGIRYTNVFPTNTPEMKDLILERCRIRQSPPEFIEMLNNKWDEYIKSMENDKGSVVNIQLNPESLNMWTTWMLME